MSDCYILGVTSDWHVNDTIGLCTPVARKSDGQYRANAIQREIWRRWLSFWDAYEEIAKSTGGKTVSLNVGDLIDLHRRIPTDLIVTLNVAEAHENLIDAVQPMLDRVDNHIVIRGTERHTGNSAEHEEWFAQDIDALPDDTTGTASWWELRRDIGGVLIDAQHHSKGIGRLRHTRNPSVVRNAKRIRDAFLDRGEKPPQLVFRAHWHTPADSYDVEPTRLIYLPSWRALGPYARRIGYGDDPFTDIGGEIVVIQGGEYEVIPKHYQLGRHRWKKILI